MADPERKPEAFPPSVEEDEEEEEEPQSTLPPDVAEREAQRAIEEIEREVEEERPSKPPTPPSVRHEGPEQTFLDKAWERQYRFEARFKRIGHGRYSRVLKMARKPEPEEFRKASQITGIGIAIIGFVGFLVYLLMQWLQQGLLGVR